MKNTRAERLQRPTSGVCVVVEVVPSDDPELLRRFDRWLQKLLLETPAPEEGRRP